MADETPVTPPTPEPPKVEEDTDTLGLPTKVDHAIRWGMVVLGIVLASLGSLYPDPTAGQGTPYPQWVRSILIIGGIVMTTFKGLGFNVTDVAKKVVGK